MATSVEEVLERAFEQAFLKALEQTVQTKAEELCRKALSQDSPLAQRLQERIEQGFQRFLDEGIRWDKKKPGFKK
jgi:flagellar biosynthesis/type III secretory pathway protein FliH